MMVAVASAPARGQELVVSAAASLTNAFREIGKAFEADNPGTAVTFNFAASDILLAQIAKGAPADVFAAADEEAMNRADRDQLLRPGTRRDFAVNQLVLIVPAAAAPVSGLPALASERFRRIAMGSPQTVPAGRYAKEALEGAKLWTALSPKLVYTQNVRQALDYVAREEADAGFVYATDAAIMPDTVKVAFSALTAKPVRYPIAAVNGTKHPLPATAFVAYVAGAPGQRVLARYGFRAP
jgi:molybdate transport system substrate-binding protein